MDKNIASLLAKKLYALVHKNIAGKHCPFSSPFSVSHKTESAYVYIRMEPCIPEIQFFGNIFNISTISVTNPGWGFGSEFFSMIKQLLNPELGIDAIMISNTNPEQLGKWILLNGFTKLPDSSLCADTNASYYLF